MNRLKDKKILVTGGAGFIGSHVVDKLVSLGAQVTVLDDLSTGKPENLDLNIDRIKFIKGDFSDPKVLEQALSDIEYVSHQAALRSVPKSLEQPRDYHKINVTGTLSLFFAAKAKGIKRVVFASSSSVYGERTDFPEKETDCPKPASPYSASKLMGEIYGYVFSKAYDLDVVSLRYFNVFGPRQSLESKYALVVPKFITCLLKGTRPPIYGDGSQERDFSYVDNVVEANISALTTEGICGEIFNLAAGEPHSVNFLLDKLKEILGVQIDPVYLDSRPGDVKKSHADSQKIKEILGWESKIDFIEGLKRTTDWFKAQTV